MKKILLVRFSSFGDVVQAMNAARELKNRYPDARLHWLTKDMFKSFLLEDSNIDHVHCLESDFEGSLMKIARFIKENEFDLIYDAHKNLRTFLLKLILFPTLIRTKWLSRPKSRWKRLLFFQLRINMFPKPFFSRVSYITPLEKMMGKIKKDGFSKLSFSQIDKSKFEFINEDYLVMAPSAAWEMKRWPVSYWKNVINHFAKEKKVILVGGPTDHFINELFDVRNANIINLAGKISFVETFFLVSRASYTLSADTGVIHCADLIGAQGGLLLGPTAFGRTYSSKVFVFEKDLACRPCTKDGRGKCSQDVYQKCMVDIKPDEVIKQIEAII